MKKNKWIIVIILLILAGIGYYFYSNGNISFSSSDGMIEVTLLDSNGNVINPFSVVQGIPGVSSMIFTVTATNTGSTELQCDIINTKVDGATNTAFDTSFTKTTKLVPSSSPKKASWTSSPISVSQFEALAQPATFAVTIRCTYQSGSNTITLPDKTGTIDLTITADEEGSFDVDVGSGGLPTEFCGDGICQSNENADSCPGDCAVANYVSFRTSDPTYVSGTGVAYSATCGSDLTAFGQVSVQSSTNYNCGYLTTVSQALCGGGAVSNLMEVPGSYGSNYGNLYLYKGTSNPERICVCATENDGVGYRFTYYSTSDSDKGNVDTTAISIDEAREVAC